MLTGRDAAAGEPVASAIRSGGGKAVFIQADNASDADWVMVVGTAEREFGRVDILVANAGSFERARTVDLSLEDFSRVSCTNLKGSFLALKHSVAAMRRGGRGGSVVMIASVTAHKGMPERIHCVASKAGVNLLAKAAALELGPEKIRVNTVLPGIVRTRMTDGFSDRALNSPPLGRPAEPEDIAESVAFLASDRSIFMTGGEIIVDGGWMAR